MKKLITKGLALVSGLIWSSNYAGQNTTAIVTETYQVSGNCGMCKKSIETAASVKGVKTAHWSETKKILTVRYDKSKTAASDVLRKVAYAGYDNEMYMAPDKAYEILHGCCQYERDPKKRYAQVGHPGQHEKLPVREQNAPLQTVSGIQKIYDGYFNTKDALIKGDAALAASAAKQMDAAIETTNMSALGGKDHDTYMKIEKELKEQAKGISASNDIEKQRKIFGLLSQTIYELMKQIRLPYEVYWDHCPMYNNGKGANWISKDIPIRNPYYGSKMMGCGSVQETLK